MCITLPTKVLSVQGNTAVVECLGEPRRVLSPFGSVNAGDWVLLYGGAIVAVITEEQALETLSLLKVGNSRTNNE